MVPSQCKALGHAFTYAFTYAARLEDEGALLDKDHGSPLLLNKLRHKFDFALTFL
ncbi:hypothetical protein JCM19239_2748 [Vibrio variabilis]|uniref:Uncharacterized protein n=1 Tax=Vibrio variabilis TaxID=990271 RepID=A0ABQ0JK78_9VIBR|nr:hypothetical protein JCM19239_2748 [Vibrio variabilis]